MTIGIFLGAPPLEDGVAHEAASVEHGVPYQHRPPVIARAVVIQVEAGELHEGGGGQVLQEERPPVATGGVAPQLRPFHLHRHQPARVHGAPVGGGVPDEDRGPLLCASATLQWGSVGQA
eukprot:8828365-Pyramimonas_sp.AAC.1